MSLDYLESASAVKWGMGIQEIDQIREHVEEGKQNAEVFHF